MRKTRECSNLKTLGADIKAARLALRLTRRALADQLGIDAQDVAVYGDGGNDLEMLTMFAHSYAPCTAQKEAQMAASAIIGPYQSYSVAKHIAETLVKEGE